MGRAFYEACGRLSLDKVLLPEGVREVGVVTDDGQEVTLQLRGKVFRGEQEQVNVYSGVGQLSFEPVSSNLLRVSARPSPAGPESDRYEEVSTEIELDDTIRRVTEEVVRLRAAARESKAEAQRQLPETLSALEAILEDYL